MILPHIKLWIVYAKEFAGETKYLGSSDVVRLSFNQWFDDEAYRADVLNGSGCPSRTIPGPRFPMLGAAAHLTKTRYSGNAESMKLLDRWRYLQEAPYAGVRQAISDYADTVDRYNSMIFGLGRPFQQHSRSEV